MRPRAIRGRRQQTPVVAVHVRAEPPLDKNKNAPAGNAQMSIGTIASREPDNDISFLAGKTEGDKCRRAGTEKKKRVNVGSPQAPRRHSGGYCPSEDPGRFSPKHSEGA